MGRAPVLPVRKPAARRRTATGAEPARPGPARLIVPAALAYCSVFALVQLGLVVTYQGRPGHAAWAVLATAGYLPVFLWQVHRAVTGARPAPAWTLVAQAAIVGVAVPVAGSHWLPVLAVVAVSAMLVLPWPRSLLVVLALALAQAPLAALVDSPVPAAASYYVFTFWWRASVLFVPIWLLRAWRQLSAARDALAEKAVVDERLRIDGEMRTVVGSALETIAAQADVAAERAGTEPAQAAHHMRAAVEVSRRASADARRLLSSYRSPSLGEEVDAAAALLEAAGIDTSIELADADRALLADPQVRSALRRATAAALHDDGAGSCVIRVTRHDGPAGLDVRVEARA